MRENEGPKPRIFTRSLLTKIINLSTETTKMTIQDVCNQVINAT